MHRLNYETLSDNLLDYLYNALSKYEVCVILIKYGYNHDDLGYLGFDIDTIKQAQEEVDING